ncbi:MAG: ImmA/IrrE family metallo-endopeptidase [Planctomycetes bacterium]|nr:ImmA/IrrE family metallo-endopeptidase [Planctomycetota bacterium]
MGNFIPARLKKAREEMGLTQEAFARAVGLSSEFISLLEAGKRAPSLNTLARISAYFNRDASFFLGEKEPAFTVLFRAAAHGLSPEARLELEHFQRYGEDYLRLEEAAGRPLELAPLYSGTLSPERMAAEERRRLGLGDEPIRDIYALLERNGCRILRRPFPENVKISGVFIFLEVQAAAFALINSAQTACRQVFTAAHEYCHYLKDRHDAPLIDSQEIFNNAPRSEGIGGRKGKPGTQNSAKEQFAQEFAARFLMPPAKVCEVVDKDFGSGRRLTYEDVLLIKRYFGTSAQAMLRTLRDLDLISAARYEDFLSLDPVAREHEVFGASAEECGASPAGNLDPIIISDRFRLLKSLSDRREANDVE